MPIELTTEYTKERLLRFQRVVAASQKGLWIFLALCTLFVCGCYVLLDTLGGDAERLLFYLILIAVLDVSYLLLFLVIPRMTVSANKSLGTVVRYVFDQAQFRMEANGAMVNETAEMPYTALKKAVRARGELFLFLGRAQAYIVDISGLSPAQTALLRQSGLADADAMLAALAKRVPGRKEVVQSYGAPKSTVSASL